MGRMIGAVVLLVALAAGRPEALEIRVLTGPEGSVAHAEIGPRIADLIRPIAERYGHGVRIETSPGSSETLRACAAETRTLCIGVVLPGAAVDLSEETRPLILGADAGRACLVAHAPPGRLSAGWHGDLSSVTVVTREGSAAGDLVSHLSASAPARTIRRHHPEDVAATAGRFAGGIALAYDFPTSGNGVTAAACAAGLAPEGLLDPDLAALIGATRTTVHRGLCEGAPPLTTLCAPAMIVASRPERFSLHGPGEGEQAMIRADFGEMIDALDWAVATELREPGAAVIFIPPAPDWSERLCPALKEAAGAADDAGDIASGVRNVLRRYGIRAVLHSSGKWIVTSGGAYVAGTIGWGAAVVALAHAPLIVTAGSTIAVVGLGVRAVCETG